MRQFGKYITFLFLLLVLAWFTLPTTLDVVYPKPPGPVLDERIRTHYKTDILQQDTDMVLLGDSSLHVAVDAVLLGSLIDKQVYKIGYNGSASAVWYLIVKNNLLASLDASNTLVLFYRDTMLTVPEFRTGGEYFKFVDELADQNDELVVQLAYRNPMGWLEEQAVQFLPIYGERSTLRSRFEYWFKYGPAYWQFDKSVMGTDNAIGSVFNNAPLDQEAVQLAMTTAEEYLFDEKHFDFDENLNNSFLPEIIRLCQEAGIQLILVRMKTLYYPSPGDEPPALQSYNESLKEYLHTKNIPLLDFSDDPRVSPEWFVDIIHLDNNFVADFTQILAHALIRETK